MFQLNPVVRVFVTCTLQLQMDRFDAVGLGSFSLRVSMYNILEHWKINQESECAILFPSAVPGYPLIEAVNSTKEAVLLWWRMRKEDETCQICSYELCYHTAGESCNEQSAKYPASNITVTDLQPGTKYYLKVCTDK